MTTSARAHSPASTATTSPVNDDGASRFVSVSTISNTVTSIHHSSPKQLPTQAIVYGSHVPRKKHYRGIHAFFTSPSDPRFKITYRGFPLPSYVHETWPKDKKQEIYDWLNANFLSNFLFEEL